MNQSENGGKPGAFYLEGLSESKVRRYDPALCTTTTAMQTSCKPVNSPSVTLRLTTKSTDCRALKPSAGQGSVCSHFSLNIPASANPDDDSMVIIIGITLR